MIHAIPTLRRCRALLAKRRSQNKEHAEQALRCLQKAGVSILAQHHNGRRTVFVIDRPPTFIRGVRRRRTTAGGVHEYTFAAPYRGVQLEWSESQEVGHG